MGGGKQASEDPTNPRNQLANRDEKGKIITPNMPNYIMKVPWYLEKGSTTLDHHKSREEKTKMNINEWYPRGEQSQQVVYKYRKGACENCGAITHAKTECMERPRKVHAKFSGKNFKSDEIIREISLDYDGKRDPFNGFDNSIYFEEMVEQDGIYEERMKISEAIGEDNGFKQMQYNREF